MVRTIFFLSIAGLLVACSQKTSPTDVITSENESESIALECVDLGMDEWDVPKSEVYLVVGATREKVSGCQACQAIPPKDYLNYDIPKNAISACGGWWAGAGDYFYAVRNEDWTIAVYAGWQDEGQMEDNDTTFHWELKLIHE